MQFAFPTCRQSSGINLELRAIGAVVVGGTPITGGRGDLVGTLIGVMLLGSIGPALIFLGVSPYWEKAIQGGIILAAVLVDAIAAGEGGGWSSRSLHVKTDSRQEEVLAILIAFEIVLFSITGRNFLSLDNFFEGVRLSAEIGLLALALTPVLITDGIDLSVESMRVSVRLALAPCGVMHICLSELPYCSPWRRASLAGR